GTSKFRFRIVPRDPVGPGIAAELPPIQATPRFTLDLETGLDPGTANVALADLGLPGLALMGVVGGELTVQTLRTPPTPGAHEGFLARSVVGEPNTSSGIGPTRDVESFRLGRFDGPSQPQGALVFSGTQPLRRLDVLRAFAFE